MKLLKAIAVGITILVASSFAQANTITLDGNVAGSGAPGSVDYQYFNVTDAGTFTIQTLTNNFDPYMFLFSWDGSLDAGDYIARNDDGGVPSGYGFNNSLISTGLAIGSYVAAVGDYYLSLSEAISGINNSTSLGIGTGTYSLQISSADGTASVPEPATMLLFGTGIVGLMGARIRMKK